MSERPGRRITVVLADDHAVVREGLRLILSAQPDLDVVGEAKDLKEVFALLAADAPAVLLLDINLGADSGLAALPRLRARHPATAVLILTMQREPAHARHALDAGAAGYVLKESAGRELVRAIRAVAAGGTYVEPELGAELIKRRIDADAEPLTRRERQVLRLIALGHTNAEIGEQLYISVRTVEAHRARIQDKLGISGRAQLIRYARDHDLIDG